MALVTGIVATALMYCISSLVLFLGSLKFCQSILFPHRCLGAPEVAFGAPRDSWVLPLKWACYVFSATVSASLVLCMAVVVDAPYFLLRFTLVALQTLAHFLLPLLGVGGFLLELGLGLHVSSLLALLLVFGGCSLSSSLLGGTVLWRIGLMGVFIIGCLSGYSAVAFPFQMVKRAHIKALLRERHFESRIPELLETISRRKMDAHVTNTGRIHSGSRTGESMPLNRDVAILQKLSQDLFLALCEEGGSQSKGGFLETRSVLLGSGIVIGCASCLKFISAAQNIIMQGLLPQSSTVDTVMKLAVKSGFRNLEGKAQLASFIFLSILILMQARSFLLTASAIARNGSNGFTVLRPTATLTMLIFAFIAAAYFLSGLFLLSPQLTTSHRSKLAEVSGMEESVVMSLKLAFDVVFVATGGVCLLFLLTTSPLTESTVDSASFLS